LFNHVSFKAFASIHAMSIQALADSLGLSISTVSRALNGYTDVSAKTRLRVQAAATAIGYQPDPIAHRLATGKTGAVAIISPVRAGNYIDATLSALISGVADVLREKRFFTLSIGLPTGDEELAELERFLNARLVDGVVLTRTRTNDPRVAMLQAKRMPFITYGRTVDNVPHAWLATDYAGATEQVTGKLLALGHTRIALVNGLPDMTFAMLGEMGFRAAMIHAGLKPDMYPLQQTQLSAEAGVAATALLMGLDDPPTAIICATDTLAFGAMLAIKNAGKVVGVDVSLVGYGNTNAGNYVVPPLATVDHDNVGNGRRLAEHLLGMLAGESPENHQILEPATLLLRGSVGQARR
jgi:LacI family transcriptional regulator